MNEELSWWVRDWGHPASWFLLQMEEAYQKAATLLSEASYLITPLSATALHTFKKRRHYWDSHHWKHRPSWIISWSTMRWKKPILFLISEHHHSSLMEKCCELIACRYNLNPVSLVSNVGVAVNYFLWVTDKSTFCTRRTKQRFNWAFSIWFCTVII